MNNIIVSTTNNIEGRNIVRYHGIVTGEAILGTNIFKDFLAAGKGFAGPRSVVRIKKSGQALVSGEIHGHEVLGDPLH